MNRLYYKLVIILAVAMFMGTGLNAANPGADGTQADTTQLQNAQDGTASSDPAENIENQEDSTDVESDSSSIVQVVDNKMSQYFETKWYDERWVGIAALVVAGLSILSFLLSIYSLWMHYYRKYTDSDDVIHLIHEESRSKQFLDKTQNGPRVEDLDYKVRMLEKEIKELKGYSPVYSNQTKREEPKPVTSATSVNVAKQMGRNGGKSGHGPNKNTPSEPVQKRYATQDASDSNRLMNVKSEFDQYEEHTFEISLDRGSQTEGSFKIIEDDGVIQRCLANSDSTLCCQIIGVGKNIKNQTPGRVLIQGDIAIVKEKAKVFVG